MSTWVLLRGLTREARHWGEFPARLGAGFPGSRVLTPDLPGCGRRWRERSPAQISGIVAAIRAELAAQRATPPYSVIALSLGAMVAVEWADKNPDEIERLVLINTSLKPFCSLFERLRPQNYARLGWVALAGVGALKRETSILRMTSATMPAGVAADWARWRREAPVSLANGLRQLLAAALYRAPSRPPSVPILLVSGAADRLVDPVCSQRIADSWGVIHCQHPAAGHDLPLDAGDWIVHLLRVEAGEMPARAPSASPGIERH